MSASRIFRYLILLTFVASCFGGEPEFPLANWDRLLKDTPPVVIAPGSISEEALRLQYLAWMERTWLAPELKRLEGTPGEAELKPLLEYTVRLFAGVESSVIPATRATQAKTILAGTERRAVTDFLCAMLLSKSGLENYQASIAGYSKVVDAPKEPVIPSLMRLIARAALLGHANNVDKENANTAQTKYYDALIPYLQSDFDEEDARWNVYCQLGSALSGVRWNREPRHIDLFLKSKLPEWARLTLAGSTHLKWGWNAAGRGWGIPKKDGYAIQEKQLAEARVQLTKAWELKPSEPYAATDMMTVVKNGGLKNGETLRTCLDRATAAVFDYSPALHEFLDSSRPYHSGSSTELVAFGRACAETRRYDSQLPTVFNESLHRLGADVEDWRPIYRHAEIGKLLIETRRLRAEKLAGTPLESDEYSQLFFENWLVGDYSAAAAALAKISRPAGYHIARETYTSASLLGVVPTYALRDTLLRRDESREEYEKGNQAYERGQYPEAITHYEALLKKADDHTKYFLIGNIALANFQEAYAKGEWTPLPISQWTCWSKLSGEAVWLEKTHHLRFTSDWEFSKLLFRGKLGKDFEVRGHLQHSRPPAEGGLGIFSGHSPFGTGRNEAFWWTMRVDCENPAQSSVQFAPKYDAEIEDPPRVETIHGVAFLYRCEKGQVTFTIGDRKITPKAKIDEDAPSGEGAFGFGVLGHGKASWAEVWDVEARRLDGPH